MTTENEPMEPWMKDGVIAAAPEQIIVDLERVMTVLMWRDPSTIKTVMALVKMLPFEEPKYLDSISESRKRVIGGTCLAAPMGG